MQIPKNRQHQLRTLFAALPPSALKRLEGTFRAGLDQGGMDFPHAEMLELLPDARPEVDLKKVFYPASLLLGEQIDRPDRIKPVILEVLWKEFRATECYAEVAGRQQNYDWHWEDFRHPLATWLRATYEEEYGRETLRTLLGNRGLEKLPMLMSLLLFAEDIGALIETWPEEIKDLGDKILIPLRDLHDMLIDVDRTITPWLLFLLYPRLRRPQEILRAVTMITRQTSDMMLLMTNLNILPEAMVMDAEELLEDLAEPFTNVDDTKVLDDKLMRFSGIIAGSGQEFDIRPQGKWGKRLAQLAGRSQLLWKRKLDQCVLAVQKVTPRTMRKTSKGRDVSDVNPANPIDPGDIQRAELALVEIKVAFFWASRLGIASLRDKYSAILDKRFNEQIDNLIDLLGDPGDADRKILQNHFAGLVRLNKAYYGLAEAEVLKRRGLAVAV